MGVANGCEKLTTFRVLSRGRLRCVQTGQIVRKKGAEQLRKRRFHEKYPRSTRSPPREATYRIEVSSAAMGFHCTGCEEYVRTPHTLPGTARCSWCKRLHDVHPRTHRW